MDDCDSRSLLRDDLLLLSLFDLSRLDVPLSDGEADDFKNTDCDLEATEGDPVLCCLLGELPYCDTVALKEYPNMHIASTNYNCF